MTTEIPAETTPTTATPVPGPTPTPRPSLPPSKPRMTIKRYYNHKEATAHLREYNADLSLELMRQPGLFAHYSVLLVQAEAQYDRLKDAADRLEAHLATVVRDAAVKAGGKLTEAQVKAAVTIDSRTIEINRACREAKQEVGCLKGTCMAFVQRKDSLSQMAFLMRKELEGQSPQVMQQSMQDNQKSRMARLSEMTLPEIDFE